MAVTRIEKLVQQFAESVAAQSDAIRRGDSKAGNRHAKRYIHAFESLRSFGDEGRDALVPLMHQGRDDVREMAAAVLLGHRPKESRAVLEELARGKGLVAFGAGEALRRWDEGSWQLDPDP